MRMVRGGGARKDGEREGWDVGRTSKLQFRRVFLDGLDWGEWVG